MHFIGRLAGRQVLKRASGGKVSKPGRVQALMRLPTLMRIGVALLRDARVPVWQKGAVVAALGLIIAPVDVVSAVPVLGQVWDMTLAVTVLETFINVAPPAVVNEHIIAMNLQKKVPLRDL